MKTIKSMLAVLLTLLIAGGAFFIQANAEDVGNIGNAEDTVNIEDTEDAEDVTIKLYDYSEEEYMVVADGLTCKGINLYFSFYKCDEQDGREPMVNKNVIIYQWLSKKCQFRFTLPKEDFDSSAASYVMVISDYIEEEKTIIHELRLSYSDLLGDKPIFNSFNGNIWLEKYESYSISVLYPVGYSGGETIINESGNYSREGLGKVFRIDKNMKLTALSKGEGKIFLCKAGNSLPCDSLIINVSDEYEEPNNFQELLRNTFYALGDGIFTVIATPFKALFMLLGWTGISIVGTLALFYSLIFI